MKQVILSAALLLCAVTAQAQTVGDTLLIEKPKQVRIETCDTLQRIVIKGMEDDDAFHYVQRIAISKPSDVRRTFSSARDFNKVKLSKCKDGKDKKNVWEARAYLDLGLTALTGLPDGYTGKVGVGEAALGIAADWYPFGAKNSWSIGLGVDWRRYCMGTESWLMKDQGNYLTPVGYDATQSDRTTRLHTFSVQVPVVYTHYFNKKQDWGLSLGAIVSFNTGAHVTRSFTLNEEEYDIRTYKIGQRAVTVDLMVKVITPGLFDFYVKYSPMNYFKNDRGPKGHQLSFGLSL